MYRCDRGRCVGAGTGGVHRRVTHTGHQSPPRLTHMLSARQTQLYTHTGTSHLLHFTTTCSMLLSINYNISAVS